MEVWELGSLLHAAKHFFQRIVMDVTIAQGDCTTTNVDASTLHV